MKLLALIIFFFTLVVLKGCGGGSSNDESASQTQYIYAAWVIIGSDEAGNNRAFARVATSYLSPSGQPVCPQINIDGRFSQMTMRAAAGEMPLRPTAFQPSVPANFPLSPAKPFCQRVRNMRVLDGNHYQFLKKGLIASY